MEIKLLLAGKLWPLRLAGKLEINPHKVDLFGKFSRQ